MFTHLNKFYDEKCSDIYYYLGGYEEYEEIEENDKYYDDLIDYYDSYYDDYNDY